MTLMRKMSIAEAKAHFSQVVEDARRGKKIVILRHGKPAAAVVPLSALEPVPKPRPMTEEEALAFFESIPQGDPTFDAVADLKAGRR